MAERRMFTKKVTDDDNFMALSSSAQALYLHLSMSADDDGFCNQVNVAMFKAHASVQDLQALLERRYVYQFENGVIVIRHWRMANALRKDRYTETVFQRELASLSIEKNGVYVSVGDGEIIAEYGDEKTDQIETARQIAYRESSLPYSFDYKIRSAFYGRKCPICGCLMQKSKDDAGIVHDNRLPTIQHNLPISKGGKHELGNISVICKQCNISIQDNETDRLNADEVIEEWEKIAGCRLVAGCLPQDRIGKDRIGEDRRERSTDPELARVMRFYTDRINAKPSTVSTSELVEFTREMGADVVIHAMEIALDERKTSFSYIRAILNNYRRNGLRSIEDVLASERRYFEAKKPRGDAPKSFSDMWREMKDDEN